MLLKENPDRIKRATLVNPNFQSFCELGKNLKYSLRLTFKNSNIESNDELKKNCPNLSFIVENKEHLHKIRLMIHFKLNIMNEIFNFLEF